MNKKIVNEAGLGRALGTAAALGAGLYGAKKLGQAMKNPQALKAAGGVAKAAGQVGSTLLQLVAPIVKEVGPAVAKSVLKQRYGIDIPDSTINAVKNAPVAATTAPAAPAAATATPSTAPAGAVPPVLPGKPTPTMTAPTPGSTNSDFQKYIMDNDDKIQTINNEFAKLGITGKNIPNKTTLDSIASRAGVSPDIVRRYFSYSYPSTGSSPTSPSTPVTSASSSSSAPTSPVSPVSPTSAGLSKDLLQKIANDTDGDVTKYIVQRGTTGKGDSALASKIQKKYGLKDQQTLDSYMSALFDSVNLKSSKNIKELNEKLKQISLLPEALQLKMLDEVAPLVAPLIGAARIAGPAIGRALTSNTAKQIGKQVAVNTGVIGANSIIDKLQKKKQTQNINNNEMEELIKSKEKKIKLSNEGIGTGTLGAVAGGALGGLPGAAIGGLVGGAAPKAVKEIKGAFEGEEGKNKEKKKKKKLKESTDYAKFVYNISQKNYAEANKYLKDIIDSKLKDRIESCLDNKLF